MNSNKKINTSKLKEILRKIKTNKVEYVLLTFLDLNSFQRGKLVSINTFVNGICKGFGFDYYILTQTLGGNMFGIKNMLPEASGNMNAFPDLNSFHIHPFEKNLGIVICDLYWKDGTPIKFYPRNALKNQLIQYKKEGIFPKIGLELEFQILKNKKQTDNNFKPYSIEKLTNQNKIIKEIQIISKCLNIEIEAICSEFAPGHLEVILKYGNMLKLCDDLTYLKLLLKQRIKEKYDLDISYKAKPFKKSAGNGIHIHIHLEDLDGKNIFSYNKKIFQYFLAGNLKHIINASIIYFPNPNSFERVKNSSANPTYANWDYDNRNVAFRVFKKNPRIENRLPGADVNIYLANICMLACGLAGIKEQYKLEEPATDFFKSASKEGKLPTKMADAVQMFSEDLILKKYLGNELYTVYLSIKQKEIADFKKKTFKMGVIE